MTTQARMFARSPRSVGRARNFVASRVDAGERADDIRVCVSELATNALRHTPAGHLFLVRVLAQEHLVRVEVHERIGHGLPPPGTSFLGVGYQRDESGKPGARGSAVRRIARTWGLPRGCGESRPSPPWRL